MIRVKHWREQSIVTLILNRSMCLWIRLIIRRDLSWNRSVCNDRKWWTIMKESMLLRITIWRLPISIDRFRVNLLVKIAINTSNSSHISSNSRMINRNTWILRIYWNLRHSAKCRYQIDSHWTIRSIETKWTMK